METIHLKGEYGSSTHWPISYAHEQCGAGAVVQAVRDALAEPGRVIRLACSEHPKNGGEVHEVLAFGVEARGPEERPSVRWAGEDGKLDGDGSRRISASLDPVEVVAVLAVAAGRTRRWVFRIADKEA